MNNMRKTLLMAALVLISAGCMAQKANVNKAKSLILSETPDYDQARQLIGAALANEETKNQANTWYVAGLSGYQQDVQANRMALLNQPLDHPRVHVPLVHHICLKGHPLGIRDMSHRPICVTQTLSRLRGHVPGDEDAVRTCLRVMKYLIGKLTGLSHGEV